MEDSALTDPLGRTVVLHKRTWQGHITKAHPEVKDERALVEQAVESPVEIRFSNSGPDCRIYYGPGPRPSVIMMVVADVVLGVVKTAHLAKKVTGGPVEWSRPTS